MPFLYIGCYSWHIQHCVPHEGIWGDVFGFFFFGWEMRVSALSCFLCGVTTCHARGSARREFHIIRPPSPSLMDPFFVTHPLGISTKKQKKTGKKHFFWLCRIFFQKRCCMNFLSSPNFPVFGDLAGNLERLPQLLLDS